MAGCFGGAGCGGLSSGSRTAGSVPAAAFSVGSGRSPKSACLGRCRRRGNRGRVRVIAHALQGGGGATGGKVRRVFVCSKCGTRHGQYHGKCNKCGGFGTIDRDGVVEEPPAAAAAGPGAGGRGAGAGGGGGAGVQALERVQQDAASAARSHAPSYSDGSAGGGGDGGGAYYAYDGRAVGWIANGGGGVGGGGGLEDVPLSLRALSELSARGLGLGLGGEGRIPLSGRTGAEVQRVLGGGVVPGALVLIGGDPGVGKSTITLQIAAMMAHPEIDFDALEEEQRQYDEYDGEGAYGTKYDNDERDRDGVASGGGDSLRGDAPQGLKAYGDGGGATYDGRFADVENGEAGRGGSGCGGDEYDTGSYDGAASVVSGDGGDDDGAEPAAAMAPSSPRTVLYVTAEETREQVVGRSRRMGLDGCDRVVVLCRSEMSSISHAILQLRPDAVVMDSINTVYLSSLPQSPGTVTQIRECGQLLLRLAKDHRVAVFIIGHVTKGGEMAGPNMLAHMVDTVLYMEGDVAQSVRLLRVIKNRHGSDAECGVFSMDGTGLHAVANHSALFLESRMADSSQCGGPDEEDSGASSVVGVTLQGSRAILVEVQALVSPLGDRAAAAAASALAYRSATGVDKLRFANLCAILDKNVPTLELAGCSVIVNVVGGAQVRDVASDLALAVAIASSYYNTPVPRDLAVCGEVDLAGRVRRSFQRLDVRLREAAKLGFRKVVIPQTKGWERLARDPQLRSAGVEVVAVRSVAEALRASLGSAVTDHRPPHIKPPPRGKPPFGTGPPGSRLSRQHRKAPLEEAPPSMETQNAWPRAAALGGGVTAAYAAAGTAPPPPAPSPPLPPPPGPWVRGGWAGPGADREYDADYGSDGEASYGNGAGDSGEGYRYDMAADAAAEWLGDGDGGDEWRVPYGGPGGGDQWRVADGGRDDGDGSSSAKYGNGGVRSGADGRASEPSLRDLQRVRRRGRAP